MDTTQFLVQDVAGNTCQVTVSSHAENPQAPSAGRGETAFARRYVLEDGSLLKRVDSEIFQVVGTGAFLTLLRE